VSIILLPDQQGLCGNQFGNSNHGTTLSRNKQAPVFISLSILLSLPPGSRSTMPVELGVDQNHVRPVKWFGDFPMRQIKSGEPIRKIYFSICSGNLRSAKRTELVSFS
jgi:hypothetical protein